MAVRAFVDLPDGIALRIGPEGLLVGRHRSCDLQLADQTASRRHALLRVGADGVELVVLGRHPVAVNERPCQTVQALRDGDRLRFPGLPCSLRVEPYEESVRVDYTLRHARMGRVQIHASPFIVGGGPNARVVIPGWPDDALVFWTAQGELHLTASEPAMVAGTELAADTPITLHSGDEVELRGERFVIEHAETGDASTVVGSSTHASAAVLEPLPRGGRVRLTFGDGDRTVYLPGRRFRLISALLQPPAPLAAGDYIPDSELIPIVWHDDDEVGGRQDVNVLLTRCRHDLVAAGIAANRFLERAPGGRATRVLLAPGARITTTAD